MRVSLSKFKWIIFLLFISESAFPVDLLDKKLCENIIYQPVNDSSSQKKFIIRVNTYRPEGSGPFPLVIINHGIKPNGNRHERQRYRVAAREFVKRGYIVMVPQRRGFGGSEGPGNFSACQPEPYALRSLDDIDATLAYARKRPDVDSQRILMIGHSVGGLITMKAAERHMPGVLAVINIAGGFFWPKCDWQTPLIDTVGKAGQSHLKSLWLYTPNDALFPSSFAIKMFEAYQKAGGKGEFINLPPFADANEGHYFFNRQHGVQLWWPEVEKFMQKLGLPTKLVTNIEETQKPNASWFAHLRDISRVPFSNSSLEEGRVGYQMFLNAKGPRAFALSEDGNSWAWSCQQGNSMDEALEICNNSTFNACKLYAVDDDVVWQ